MLWTRWTVVVGLLVSPWGGVVHAALTDLKNNIVHVRETPGENRVRFGENTEMAPDFRPIFSRRSPAPTPSLVDTHPEDAQSVIEVNLPVTDGLVLTSEKEPSLHDDLP